MTTVGTIERLLWLDLETTGLDHATCGIIEVAWAITPLLDIPRELDVKTMVVRPGDVVWERGAHEMHLASGLAAAAIRSPHMLYEAWNDILEALGPKDSAITTYLAGSSIHFDRGFIRKRMWLIEERLHHRMLDVSAVVLARRAQGWQSPPSPDPKPHRAEADIRASHALLLAAMGGGS